MRNETRTSYGWCRRYGSTSVKPADVFLFRCADCLAQYESPLDDRKACPVCCGAKQRGGGGMSARLLHYSDEPITAVHSVAQGQPNARKDKPAGLWVSVEGEDDWRSWCEAESFGDPSAQLCYEVTLAADAKVLRLSDAPAILAFSKRYECDPYFGRIRTMMSRYAIAWEAVAEKWDGIIIAPYCWELRLDERTAWYYGWDCASGCIWNADAIASLSLIRSEVAA